MIFMVQQLIEKAIEHSTKQFFVFVDLHKAYESIPCAELWIPLRKLGIPKDMISLVHEDMKTRVRVDGELLEIKVNNG